MVKNILSLERDLPIEKREWPILRMGWVIMGLIVIGGASGLFGGGYLSHRKFTDKRTSVAYDKVLRYSLSSEIIIESDKLSKDSSLVINSDYTKKIKIEEISPAPQSVKMEGNKIKYKFASVNSNSIVFYIKPIGRGKQQLLLELNGFRLNVDQLILF